MKYLILLLLIPFNIYAVNLIIDPTIPGQSTLTMTCVYPIEREDGTPLAIGEIATVKFYVESNGVGGFVPAGSNSTACRQVYDMSAVADGVYVYVATTLDTDGRESVFSAVNLTATVKRMANPKAPTGIAGSLSQAQWSAG